MAILVGTVNFDKTLSVVSSHDTLEEANPAAVSLVESTTRSTRYVFVAQGSEEDYEISSYLDVP